jgi:predicted transcriptional regulator
VTTLDLFRHDFILSIKPEYATKIVEGLKTVELRRRFPYGTVTGAVLYVYATVPIQALIGYATIRDVVKLPTEDIWAEYNKVAYITRSDFDDYYAGSNAGFVIRLKNPVRLQRPITLTELKTNLDFTPPQSFTYADEALKSLVRGR